jgi:RHS repeat-associated protein
MELILQPPEFVTATFYVRDASGNVMAVYKTSGTTNLTLEEQHIYGSSRLGIFKKDKTIKNKARALGERRYELTDHLGNVRVVMSDYKRTAVIVLSATDYYPFGMIARTYTSPEEYRYGFGNMEKDNETFEGAYDFGARILDVRLGRWLAVDPLWKSYLPVSSFTFSLNNPIFFIDTDGREVFDKNGQKITYTELVDKDGKVTLLINGELDESTKQIFYALIKTPTGRDAIKRVLDIQQDVVLTLTDKVIPGAHAFTDFFDENGKKITQSDNEKAFIGDKNMIKITISTAKTGDGMDVFDLEMLVNTVGVHEILGHIAPTGAKQDHNHDDMFSNKSVTYTSTAMYEHMRAIIQYVLITDKDISLAVSGYFIENYTKGLSFREAKENYRTNAIKMINEIYTDPNIAKEKIDAFNQALDNAFPTKEKKQKKK